MCGGGSFGQYPVSFWISELNDVKWFKKNAEEFSQQLHKLPGVREIYYDLNEGKLTLLCVYGQTDRELLSEGVQTIIRKYRTSV